MSEKRSWTSCEWGVLKSVQSQCEDSKLQGADIEVVKVTCRPLRWDGELRDKYRDKDGRKYRRLALGLVE